MKDQEYYSKTDEVISRFKNGKTLYQNSAMFNQVVQMLVRDVDPYEVIEQLVQITQDNQNALIQYIHRDTRPMIMRPIDSAI